ncbi:hypothetical protein RSW15_24515, partial [Escherichia coli]|uniref:hypothetical protein n=1 Tax=Escherichia coli TaxID=562 RepID=UPI0028DFD5FD
MTVYDQNGNVILSLDALTGQPPSSAVVYLLTGTYTISYSVRTTSGNFTPVDFWMWGETLSDPIGPYYTGNSSTSTGSGYSYN